MIKLNKKMTLFVPVADNDNQPINVEGIESELLKVAGGCSVYDVQGAWLSKGKIYNDTIKAMQVNYNSDDKETADKLQATIQTLVAYLITTGGQEAVSVESYGGLTIYDKEDLPQLEQVESILKALA